MGTMHADVSLLTASSTHPRDSRSASLVGQWRSQLLQLHFTTWRIDHDLQAVHACLHDLGPPERWSQAALRARFIRRRSGRAVNDAPLEEIAVRRFQRFALRPDESALEAEILAAWWDRLLVCGRKLETCEKYRDAILLFGDAAGPVWRASMRSLDVFGAQRVGAGCARESLRASQGAIRRFIDFIVDPADEWAERILRLTGCRIRQIATPANTLVHVRSCPEGTVGRAFSDTELRRFFAHVRTVMESATSAHRKGRWTAARDYALYQFMLATGARDSDLDGLRLSDLSPAYGETTRFSAFEQVDFLGKSDPGGPAKLRMVQSIELFASQWATFEWYLHVVRPRLIGPGSGDAVFLSERGHPLRANDISRIFRDYRCGASLPGELHAHCLRHTFAVRLSQIEVDLGIIQRLMGHNSEATTMRYAKLAPPFMRRRLLDCCRRQRRESDARAS